MIAIDTSAIMAILLDQAEADACATILEEADHLVLSAGTLAELLIVAARRNVGQEAERLLTGLAVEVMPVTPAAARRIAAAYDRWGKGIHPAGLNFGDCFAYEVAVELACPLLFVGDDFRRTDIANALSS